MAIQKDAKESAETPLKSARILLFPAVPSPDQVENSVADPLPAQIVRKIDEVIAKPTADGRGQSSLLFRGCSERA